VEVAVRLPSLLLTLAALAPGPAEAGPLRGVTTCDVRRLTTWYGTTAKVKRVLRAVAKDSKVVIDTPNGPMRDTVFYEVEGARKVPAKCTFGEAGYDYDDSVLLASVWGTDPDGARKIVEEKISYGDEYSVIWALEEARAGEATPPTAEDAAVEAFLLGDRYTYCDARLLAAHWQIDVYAAKVTIGTKIRNRQEGVLDATLQPARYAAVARGETCAFWETGYTYEDAVRLASTWRTSVEIAKARVGDMVMRGENPAVRQMLKHGG
jgi:hypothetical protein